MHASIGYEGSAMEPVYVRVARDLAAVKETISTMADRDGDVVICWSADQLRAWSNRPWTSDGSQPPLVHHVSVGLKVEFGDFTALSEWVGRQVAATEGFRVSTIEWNLTAVHRDELLLEVRNHAVQDAVTRAQHYADALGLGPIRPIALADAGMLADAGLADIPGVARLRNTAASVGGPPEVELIPRDIELSADVDARFVAGP